MERDGSEEVIGGQFVYLYRDKDGKPLYVGRGRNTARSLSHTGPRAHNEQLTELLNDIKDFSIEIAGPFGDEKTAAFVEGALISALKGTPSFKIRNKVSGPSTSNFRPIGVPAEFSDRAFDLPLAHADLKIVTGGKPALVVLVKDKPTTDGRVGIDLANPPTALEIQERMDRWWQLNKKMADWQTKPKLIPSVLIAVSGSPKHRVVVGSLKIDTTMHLPWEAKKGGLSRVPVIHHPKLDYGEIRGRRIAPELAKFGGIKSAFFKII